MKNYVIINGVNSLTITGLAISKLPSISKPPLRVMTEEINGRDGDLITDLGYGAYDKELVIGLYGNYDINEVIGFFNQEGTIVFSNENDKYYNFKIINQIDYEALIKFRTATISLHCQPFKYPLTETPEEITTEYVEEEGETLTLNDTKIAPLSITPKGNTNQNGTPTPSSPIPVNVVSGDNEVDIVGKNLLDLSLFNNTEYYSITDNNVISLKNDNRGWSSLPYITLNAGTYTLVTDNTIKRVQVGNIDTIQAIATATSGNYLQFTLTATSKIGFKLFGLSGDTYPITYTKPMLLKGAYSTYPTSYTPYTSQNYPLYLGVENLLDLKNGTYTNNGVTAVVTNGQVLLNGTPTSGSSFITIQLNKNINWVNGKDHTIMINNTSIGTENTYGAVRIDLNGTLDIKFNIANNYKVVNIDVSSVYNDKIQIRTGYGITYNNYVIEPKIIVASKPNYISDTPIELNKIGTYQDYIYKTDKWYLHKEVGKVVLNGSETWTINASGTANWFYKATISSIDINTDSTASNSLCDHYAFGVVGSSNTNTGYYIVKYTKEVRIRYGTEDTIANYKTWLSSNNVSLYYVLLTPTETEITNTTLINQLENLKGAMSYEGQTNISQVNNDLPFILKVKGTKEGSGEGIINNIGNIYAKPIIELEGTGNIGIYKNGTQYFEVDMSSDNEITIDTEKMEAYHNGVLKNRKVIGDYNKFTIDEGNNNIEITGELTKATISNYTRWL